jgi:CRP/FNR family cyclic AMP-dependent transcriptional regulator
VSNRFEPPGAARSLRSVGEATPEIDGSGQPVQAGTIALLNLYSEWATGLNARELEAVRRTLLLPVVRVAPGYCDVKACAAAGEAQGVFGVVVIDGLLIGEMWLAGQAAAQIYGPGDVLRLDDEVHGSLATARALHTPVVTSLALLDRRFLAAMGRWPRLAADFFTQSMRQIERAREHQVISQLTRVEDRLLALFWGLANRWGRVGREGVSIAVPLTHEIIGRMVGARRPTVTLGLRTLARQRLLWREGQTWLLATDSLQLVTHPRSEDSASRLA